MSLTGRALSGIHPGSSSPAQKSLPVILTCSPGRHRRRGRQDRSFTAAYDAFLPNSTFTQGYLKEYWPEIPAGKIHLLYPPIAPVPDRGIAKEKLILVCSRIDAAKKLELLIDAYRSSSFLHENYQLAIAGNNASDTVDYWEKICAYAGGGRRGAKPQSCGALPQRLMGQDSGIV